MVRFRDYGEHVEELYAAALAAVNPRTAVKRYLKREGFIIRAADSSYDLSEGRVFVVSVGKAAVPMAAAAVEIVGQSLAAAVVIDKRGSGVEVEPVLSGNAAVQLLYGSHPVSDAASVAATAVAIETVRDAGPQDLVLCLISGGASALLTQPRIPLADWQALINALLASGCTINELNTVRRHLDQVKGGGLAQLVAPARCITLVLSDVVGNPMHTIGSGPTVAGADSAQDALAVLQRFDIRSCLPATTYLRVERSLRELTIARVAMPVVNDVYIVGDVRIAAIAALTRAVQLGFVSQLLTVHLEGEAREVGRVAAALAKDAFPGRCLILGGETTVTVRGAGRGGRNQELALAAAMALEGMDSVVVASLATDGEDGPTSAAGARVSGQTAVEARAHGLVPEEYLAANDSFGFFERLDVAMATPEQETDSNPTTLVQTGSTGTNVNDLLFILTYPELEATGSPDTTGSTQPKQSEATI